MKKKILLSVALITYNEEKKLAECLRSVPFADEIVVVDSHSTDKTQEIALQFNAQFYERPFTDFSSQKNAAIEKTSGKWVLLLDADERLSSELQSEIRTVISDEEALDLYCVKRRNYLFGGRMRFGANFQDWQLRLMRRQKGKFEGLVHERIRSDGKTGHLKGELIHHSYQTLQEYFAKFPLFCALDAKTMWREGKKPTGYHFLIKPPLFFLYFYLLKLGFLDGFRGLLYHLLSTYYLYSKYWKTLKLYRVSGIYHESQSSTLSLGEGV